ncbi:MAG: glycerophosphodiester phosphodiesterase [Bacillota bacterium]|nr:glycerophosphodiester phosphodiesterase [Bacillota bacterium]
MTKIYGHRGLSSLYPENTMIAYKKAYEAGMDGIELDVHMTKDGELVLIHDYILDSTTESSGFIKDYNYKDIKKLSAGKKFDKKFSSEKIPLLQEVLGYFKDKNFEINIEIKAGYRFYKDIEVKVIEKIDKYYNKDKIIISSFDHYSILRCKEVDSSIKTGALLEASLYKPWDYLKQIKADYIHPQFLSVTDDFIDEAHNEGIGINTYTVDDINMIKHFIDKKLNIVITNKNLWINN